MSDGFTHNKLIWPDRLASDPSVTHAGFRLAYALSGHFNRATGDAWPTQRTLAAAIGVSDRTIRTLTDELVEAGYLMVESGGGRRKSNKFRPILNNRKPTSGFSDEKSGSRLPGFEHKSGSPLPVYTQKSGSQLPGLASETRKFDVDKPGSPLPTEHYEEHTERERAKKKAAFGTRLPEGWRPTVEGLALAAKEIGRETVERVLASFADGTVKANKYRRFSASNPAERVGNS